ncbi:hypothetical protein J437_LFUL010668 [Ladona fulva]|uniref:PiggyBac transposable element-derived protein domain-containing protein n=1 Tax=Ladona fulva TaxID=123851 RepID=A0A8K0KAK2_LADFU|nr:hypothetical protein J437_LFUL010668 [Ladona fulva]
MASSTVSKGIVWSFTKPNSGNTAMDFFTLLATDVFFNLIVNYTNFYANQLLRSCTTPQARVKQWKELTIPEFKQFLGLLFHMGTNNKMCKTCRLLEKGLSF